MISDAPTAIKDRDRYFLAVIELLWAREQKRPGK
jgi:hypothetical protein